MIDLLCESWKEIHCHANLVAKASYFLLCFSKINRLAPGFHLHKDPVSRRRAYFALNANKSWVFACQ